MPRMLPMARSSTELGDMFRIAGLTATRRLRSCYGRGFTCDPRLNSVQRAGQAQVLFNCQKGAPAGAP